MVENIRLVENNDGSYDIIVDLNRADTEIALDFLSRDNLAKQKDEVAEFIKSAAKNLKIKSVKFAISGLVVATVASAALGLNSSAAQNSTVSAYVYQGTVAQQIEYVNKTNHALDVVYPSFFDINADGSLKSNIGTTNIISSMHSQGIKVVPFISNHWDRQAGINALNNIETLTTQIANYVRQYNLDGVNVDIENVTHEQKNQYTEFVKRLRDKLGSGAEISVAVAANPKGWTTGWHGSYDYAALAKHADYLVIMAYDESFQGGAAGPVASASFVEDSIKYALKYTSSSKLVLAVPFYGRLWSNDGYFNGQGIQLKQAEEIVSYYGGNITYDQTAKSVKATFTVTSAKFSINGRSLAPGQYTLWYENNASLKEKLSLVTKHKLAGSAVWQLGGESSGVWDNYLSWQGISNSTGGGNTGGSAGGGTGGTTSKGTGGTTGTASKKSQPTSASGNKTGSSGTGGSNTVSTESTDQDIAGDQEISEDDDINISNEEIDSADYAYENQDSSLAADTGDLADESEAKDKNGLFPLITLASVGALVPGAKYTAYKMKNKNTGNDEPGEESDEEIKND